MTRTRTGRPRVDPLVRFRSYYTVDPVTGCWVWQNHITPKGYGHFKTARDRQGAAHREGYLLLVGPIPDGLQLDHLCHSRDETCAGGPTCLHRRCVNPDHLEVVTLAENVRRGIRCRPKAAPRRPTPRQRLLAEHYTSTQVADLFGVDRQTISRRVRVGQLRAVHKFPGSTGGYLFDRATIDSLLRNAA